jgi:hypothetical protein
MKPEAVGVVAISPETAAGIVRYGQHEMLAPDHFQKLARRFIAIDLAVLIHEPPVVY